MAIEVRIITNNELCKRKSAEYDNGLIIEMIAKLSFPLFVNMKVYMSISDYQPFVSFSTGGFNNIQCKFEFFICRT